MTYAPPKILLPEPVVKVVTPIFNRLGKLGFLEGCKNVSFNKVLWSLCPKEQFNSPTATFFVVSVAVCFYNSGLDYTLTSLLKNTGLESDTCSQRESRSVDKERMRKGGYAVGDAWKEKRKL